MAGPPPMISPPALKPDWRRQLRRLRAGHVASLDGAARHAAACDLADRLLPLLAGYHCIAAYVAQGDEPDLNATCARLRGRGAALALPRLTESGDAMDFALWLEGRPLTSGWRGLPQPDAAAHTAWPDAILLPLVGIDRRGFRLGQGKGHYDRALATLAADGASPLLIGIGWEVQLVDRLPTDAWDVPLDAFAAPSCTLAFTGRAG